LRSHTFQDRFRADATGQLLDPRHARIVAFGDNMRGTEFEHEILTALVPPAAQIEQWHIRVKTPIRLSARLLATASPFRGKPSSGPLQGCELLAEIVSHFDEIRVDQ
jgi:hypothetical protein